MSGFLSEGVNKVQIRIIMQEVMIDPTFLWINIVC